MIDPLTAIGLAANIIQLIEVGVKVVGTGHELTAYGTTRAHDDLKFLCTDTASVCEELNAQLGPSSSKERLRSRKRMHGFDLDESRPRKHRGTFGGEKNDGSDSESESEPERVAKAPPLPLPKPMPVKPTEYDLEDSFPELEDPFKALDDKDSRGIETQEGIRRLAGRTKEVAEELSSYMEAFTLNETQQAQHASKPRHKRGITALKLSLKGLGKGEATVKMRKSLKRLQQNMILRLLAAQRSGNPCPSHARILTPQVANHCFG